MIKIMTINNFHRTSLADKREQYTWSITDEKGQQRQVHAHAQINEQQQIESYRPLNVREIPLVEILLKHRIGDTFTIDFTEFNQRHCYNQRSTFHNKIQQERHNTAENIDQLFSTAGFAQDGTSSKDELTAQGFV